MCVDNEFLATRAAEQMRAFSQYARKRRIHPALSFGMILGAIAAGAECAGFYCAIDDVRFFSGCVGCLNRLRKMPENCNIFVLDYLCNRLDGSPL